MKSLLVAGPDSTLNDAYELALELWPTRRIDKLHISSCDYYQFDLSCLENYSKDTWNVALAVNEFYINDVRRALREKISELGYQFTSLVSPRAHISQSAKIGKNAIIHAGCFIGSNSALGDFCCLRPNVVLAENVHIGSFVTLEANVAIRENCIINDFVTICAGSSLTRCTNIGAHSYLNLSKQYSGSIPMATFFSPVFPEPIQVLGLHKEIENS